MPKKTIKLVDIPSPGDNSVKGSIFETHGSSVFSNLDEFCWLISVPKHLIEYIERECKEMKLDEYIIMDRNTANFNF